MFSVSLRYWLQCCFSMRLCKSTGIAILIIFIMTYVSYLQMGAKSSKHVPKPFTSVRRGRGNTVRIINVLPASPTSPASHDLLTSPENISSASEGGLQMVDVEDGSSNDSFKPMWTTLRIPMLK